MKIKCSASHDEISSEDAVQINITPIRGNECELVLFDKPEFVEIDGVMVDNRDFCNNVFADILLPNLSDFFGNEKLAEYLEETDMPQIIIFKDHPKFDSIIKMVEASQVLS